MSRREEEQWYLERGIAVLDMNVEIAQAQQQLDRYPTTGSAVALNVTSALAGKITGVWVNKAPEGSKLPLPVTCKADGNSFEIGISYRNDSGQSITAGIEVKVTRPDGGIIAPTIDWSSIGSGKTLTKEYNIAAVTQTGQWLCVIRLLGY